MKKYYRHLICWITVLSMLFVIPLQVMAEGSGLSPKGTKAASGAETGSSTASTASAGGESAESADPGKPFSYVHDPMENPKAAEDIIVNPDAVYGYSPSPDSVRLGEFAGEDWSDEALVESARQQRLAYHDSIEELYRLIEQMLGEAKNIEEIARAVSTRRNEIRLESYANDPEGLEKAKKSNLETYGNENGPTPESLYEKYGSWQTVLEKALSSNPGMDACLGLYDDYYDTYDLEENALTADSSQTGGETQRGEDASETPDRTETDDDTAALPRTYTVVSGDSLWNIALEKYGDGEKWDLIYEANREKIRDPGLIFPGQELEIPNAA